MATISGFIVAVLSAIIAIVWSLLIAVFNIWNIILGPGATVIIAVLCGVYMLVISSKFRKTVGRIFTKHIPMVIYEIDYFIVRSSKLVMKAVPSKILIKK